jgi:hypothetical protein
VGRQQQYVVGGQDHVTVLDVPLFTCHATVISVIATLAC